MRGNILKVKDEFKEVDTRTIDYRNRLTLGELMKGSKESAYTRMTLENCSYSLSLKFPPPKPGFSGMNKQWKTSKQG